MSIRLLYLIFIRLPEPVNLDHYRVRKQAHVGGLIKEYRLVA